MAVYEEPVWEEPTVTSKMRKYERVMAPLMDYPEHWGKIAEYKSDSSAYQAAINLRKGQYVIPGEPEQWEFVSDENAVYARFVGNEQAKKGTIKSSKKSTSRNGS